MSGLLTINSCWRGSPRAVSRHRKEVSDRNCREIPLLGRPRKSGRAAVLVGHQEHPALAEGSWHPCGRSSTSVFVIKRCWEYTAQPTQPGCARLAAHVPVFCLWLPKRKYGSPAHIIYNTRSHLNTSLFGTVLHLHNGWFFSLVSHSTS